MDVGGAFIHGTGRLTTTTTTAADGDGRRRRDVGPHDLGAGATRKSERLRPAAGGGGGGGGGGGARVGTKRSRSGGGGAVKLRRSEDGIGSLNPVYVLARQKLRLPLRASQGSQTCLVDHRGDPVSEEVDREVSDEFNDVLELATRCCERGRYIWKTMTKEDQDADSASASKVTSGGGVVSSHREERDGASTVDGDRPSPGRRSALTEDGEEVSVAAIESPETGGDIAPAAPPWSTNYVSDDTSAHNDDDAATIDPSTDFGRVFEECRRHLAEIRRRTSETTAGGDGGGKNDNRNDPPSTDVDGNDGGDEEAVLRWNLFRWHVAQLEMSSGAPMNLLGQKWNGDEPFGYGGDHSYLEGGMRDVVEALAEGFECRGVGGDHRSAETSSSSPGGDNGMGHDVGNRLRRSGDFASLFGRSSSWAGGIEPAGFGSGGGGGGNGNGSSRGVIQCGIEVIGVEIFEKEDAKLLRMQKRKETNPSQRPVVGVDETSLRRSTRERRGSMMKSLLGALSSSRCSGGELHDTVRASPSSPAIDGTTSPPLASSYGNEQSTVVRVATKCGLTLEADAVIVTLPLAILSIPPGSPGHISFDPPLPTAKRNALTRLGVGTYNKCEFPSA